MALCLFQSLGWLGLILLCLVAIVAVAATIFVVTAFIYACYRLLKAYFTGGKDGLKRFIEDCRRDTNGYQ